MHERRSHGGRDAIGIAKFDFSTNSNGCGPCPQVIQAIEGTDSSRYPDPEYNSVRVALAEFHRVEESRIVLAGSASEFIFRVTAYCAQNGFRSEKPASYSTPQYCYGDYGYAATAWSLSKADSLEADLNWACDPGSPTGQTDDSLPDQVDNLSGRQTLVLDCAYRPLQLAGSSSLSSSQLDRVWQLWSPNKVLGVTGIRAAYAIAPRTALEATMQLQRLAPSWIVGAHGCSMLHSWVKADVQEWARQSRHILSRWKKRQIEVCESLGWSVHPSKTNFFLADLSGYPVDACIRSLRDRGIKLRDASSFGLPGNARLGVLHPVAQDELWREWSDIKKAPVNLGSWEPYRLLSLPTPISSHF